MSSNNITIVIPMYNPHPGWEEELNLSITRLLGYFKNRDFTLVIVNDGSPNNIESEINKLLEKYPFIVYHGYKENKGKGHAIREGVKLISSDYYIYTDWDFPFGQKIVYETFRMLKEKPCDLVIGKRNETYFDSLPIMRRIISKSLKITNYITTGFRVVDTQAGLKGLTRKAREILLLTKINGFIFELEFIRACLKQNISYSFIDISIKENLRLSNFSWRTIYKELKTYFKIFLGQ